MSELNIQYQFKNKKFLDEALTHKSYAIETNKNKPHNERLEFLGDAILNFVIAADLLKKHADESEGFLSKKRASRVNQTTLAVLAKEIHLQEAILFGPGEVKQGSPLNPRILASALEALIGAIYLDSSFSHVEKWILNLFQSFSVDLEHSLTDDLDFKTRLQELTQKQKMGTPVYEVVFTKGPSHKPQFLVSLKLDSIEKARAEGASKKMAEQKAAEIYLTELLKSTPATTKGDR